MATRGIGAVTEDDGALPDRVTVFDDGHSGVANLHPDLLRALREAATDAAEDGIDLSVNSGWRSSAYQEQLFREAVSRYGSEREAARWVARADTSAHVSGDAVDIGPFAATAWLSEHGAGYGLCQTYRNEAWHYELRPAAIDRGCPPHVRRLRARPESAALTGRRQSACLASLQSGDAGESGQSPLHRP